MFSGVAYLVQGPATHAEVWKERIDLLGRTATLFYHSYDKPCDICLYRTGTVHPTGRNFLLRHALNHPQNHIFKYYSFIDFDILLHCKSSEKESQCWLEWHEMLITLETTYAQVVPKTWKDPPGEKTNMQVCVDNAMVTVHQRALYLAMPQSEYLTHLGIWYNTHALSMVLHRCLTLSIKSDERWAISNPVHSKYTGYGPHGYNATIVYLILEHDYAALGPWRKDKVLKRRCLVSSKVTSSWRVGERCDKILRQRFDKWRRSDKLW